MDKNMRQKKQENSPFMQAQELNSMFDNMEDEGPGGFLGGGGGNPFQTNCTTRPASLATSSIAWCWWTTAARARASSSSSGRTW